MDDEYAKIRDNAVNIYKRQNKIFCPYFDENIVLGAEGFNHLIYKNKSERSKDEQIMRFKLLKKAIELISLTNTDQDFFESIMKIKKKRYKKVIEVSENICYYGFIGIIDNFRIKVVIRKVGNGNKHFWSVIPAWNTRYYQGIKNI